VKALGSWLRVVTHDRRRRAILGYALAIGAAEVCIAFVSPVAGAIGYAALLLAMLTYAVLLAPDADDPQLRDYRNAIVALSFLPIVRLVSLTAPVGAGSTAGRYLLVGALLLAAIAWAAWAVRLPGAGLRLRVPILQLGVVCSIVPLALIAYYTVHPKQVASGDSRSQLAAAAIAVAVVAVVEEFVFRGFIQTAFGRLFGSIAAPLCATALYVIVYLGVRPLSLVFFAAVLGLLFGWLVQRTQSLAGAAIGHSLFNVSLFVVLPLLASSRA
jgi:membrane protease YdiL (CAAX protease family)